MGSSSLADRARNLKYYILQMSTYLKPPLYSKRGLEQQLKNLMFQGHELICGCNTPNDHLQYLLNQEKCHLSDPTATTAETGGEKETDDLGIDAGDLETLFATENDVDEG